MRVKDLVGLGLALVAAAGVAYVTRLILTSDKAPVPQVAPQVQVKSASVMVAARPLGVGDLLDVGSLKWAEWPLDAQGLDNYLTEPTAKLEDFYGAVVKDALDAGEPLTPSDIIKPGDRSFLAAVLKPGMRAISINVNDASSSSGLIMPGDRVDVIVSKTVQSGNEGVQSVVQADTIIKNVRVVAFGRKLKPDTPSSGQVGVALAEASPKTVTLEVTPAQAELVAQAQKEGDILLSVEPLEKDLNPGLVDAEQEAPKNTIKIIRGSKTSSITIND